MLNHTTIKQSKDFILNFTDSKLNFFVLSQIKTNVRNGVFVTNCVKTVLVVTNAHVPLGTSEKTEQPVWPILQCKR